MASMVDSAAQAIAEALSPSPSIPSARWRWGTVVSVGNDGTMNVSIGGATVPGIRCAQHVMGAQVGDRVRVLYCGTECMVDAIRAADSEPHIDAQEWLDALGLTTTDWDYLVGSSSTLSSGNFVRWRAKAGWVFVQVMYRSGAGVTTASKNVGTIPSAYSPSANVETAAYLGASNDHIGTIWVDTGGNVVLAATASSSAIYGCISYPLD